MLQTRLSLLSMTVTVLAVLDTTTAIPFRYLGYRPSSAVRLTVYIPLSGTDIAVSRAEALHPFLNPGIVPIDHVLVGQLEAQSQVLLEQNPMAGTGNSDGKKLSGF
ncbi:hypothetical protein BsWGS_07633 [Bradybaena similaris]